MTPSTTHLVLIPSYNTGNRVFSTVREARNYWNPVWVVVDGSSDGTGAGLKAVAESDAGLRVLLHSKNRGKGAALLSGLREAEGQGFTHVLTMDADGQHPAQCITEFMAISQARADALVLGVPVFDESAPRLRKSGRKISNWWAGLETLWLGIGDSLFGFRVYPIAPLRAVMESGFFMRRFDFDPEAAVRLCWRGLQPINVLAPVKYFSPDEGGVSHFHYVRDNALLTWMHMRLMAGFLIRLPLLLRRKFRPSLHRSR